MVELYLRRQDFIASELIDNFETLVWTERFSSSGEFNLTCRYSNLLWGALNRYGQQYLSNTDSPVLMMVENLEIKNQKGSSQDLIQISGREFSSFLENRSNKTRSTTEPIVITDTPMGIVKYLIDRYAINVATAGAENVINNLSVALTPTAQPSTTQAIDRGDLYSQLTALCDSYNFGFSTMLDVSDNTVTIYLLEGTDYTVWTPGAYSYREFSPDLENLRDVSVLKSKQAFKNHARILSGRGDIGTDYYLPGFSSTVANTDRRTLVVEARDIGTDPALTDDQVRDLLKLRGAIELATINNRFVDYVSGDIPVDANAGLGNIVMVKGKTGEPIKSQITEMITTIDGSGKKKKPTFTAVA